MVSCGYINNLSYVYPVADVFIWPIEYSFCNPGLLFFANEDDLHAWLADGQVMSQQSQDQPSDASFWHVHCDFCS